MSYRTIEEIEADEERLLEEKKEALKEGKKDAIKQVKDLILKHSLTKGDLRGKVIKQLMGIA